jgi:hypothetical protein
MRPRVARLVCLAIAACALLGAAPAFADDPPSKRGKAAASEEVVPAGSQGLRPFFGAAGHLDVAIPTPAGGNKILFGLDYLMGGPTGFAFAVGMHLGAGGRTFLLHPVAELHYRFALPVPLVPWVGAGVGVKLAFAQQSSVNIALGFRFVAGLEYYLTPGIALGTQVALPDIGPRLTPDTLVVGTLEWTFGPQFHF